MTDKLLLDAIASRGSPALFQQAFKQWGWLRLLGHGWAATRLKIEAELAGPDAGAVREVLNNVLIESYCYANKAVFFWKISEPEIIEQLIQLLPTWVKVDENPYGNLFPIPKDDESLRAITQQGVPTHFMSGDEHCTLLLCGKRRVAVEEKFSQEQIPDDFRRQGYDELVARKMLVFQTYDSFSVYPKQGLVELRIDYGHKQAERDVLNCRESLREKINALSKNAIACDVLVGDPINLFQALSILYLGEGWTVNRIGHANEDGFINANKGRHKKDDVRKSLYHQSGENGVDQLQLWSLAATFDGFSGVGRPRLLLEGQSAMLSSMHPVLHLARILDCSGEEDYHLVRSSLLTSWHAANKTAEITSSTTTIPLTCPAILTQ